MPGNGFTTLSGFFLIASLLAFPCCSQHQPGPAWPESTKDDSSKTRKANRLLRKNVEIFSEDIGPDGQQAWEELQAGGRLELANSLLKLRDSTLEDDYLRIQIAFVFCNLDYDYDSNKQLIISYVTGPPGKNLNVDMAQMMVERMINRGDKSLLKVLFSIAPDSDGCLAEGLEGTFTDEMESEPSIFLNMLKDESPPVRQSVYELLDPVLSKKAKAYLRRVPRYSPISLVATEMLVSAKKYRPELNDPY